MKKKKKKKKKVNLVSFTYSLPPWEQREQRSGRRRRITSKWLGSSSSSLRAAIIMHLNGLAFLLQRTSSEMTCFLYLKVASSSSSSSSFRRGNWSSSSIQLMRTALNSTKKEKEKKKKLLLWSEHRAESREQSGVRLIEWKVANRIRVYNFKIFTYFYVAARSRARSRRDCVCVTAHPPPVLFNCVNSIFNWKPG